MHVVRVEHAVRDFDEWKRTFDSDPLDRKSSGVKAYRIMRKTDEPDFVMIDLEFDELSQAERFEAGLEELWGRVDIMRDPQARVAELVEAGEN